MSYNILDSKLGCGIPPQDQHAVSVSLPKWSDVVGYEEGDEEVVSKLQCGYPRFVYHPLIVELNSLWSAFHQIQKKVYSFDDTSNTTGETELETNDNRHFNTMAFPSPNVSERCRNFLLHPSHGCSEDEVHTFDDIFLQVSFVTYPEQLEAVAKAYWQHAGEGISSRHAFYALQKLKFHIEESRKQTITTRNDDDAGMTNEGNYNHCNENENENNTILNSTISQYLEKEDIIHLDAVDCNYHIKNKIISLINNKGKIDKTLSPRSENNENIVTNNNDEYGNNDTTNDINNGSLAFNNNTTTNASLSSSPSFSLPSYSPKQPSNNSLYRGSSSRKEEDSILLYPDDISLFPSGMNAIFLAYQICKEIHQYKNVQTNFYEEDSQAVAVIFGFPYLDTLKIVRRIEWNGGNQVLFYPNGNDEDIDTLTSILNNNEMNIMGIFTEIPSNPLLTVPNIPRLKYLSEEYNFPLVIDDTIGSFANLALLSSFPYGNWCDILVSSLTKIFSGYCNLLAGSLCINPQSQHYDEIKSILPNLIDSKWTNVRLKSTYNAITSETYTAKPEPFYIYNTEIPSLKEMKDCLFREDMIQLWRNCKEYEDRNEKINRNTENLVDWLHELNNKTNLGLQQINYPKYTRPKMFQYLATPRIEKNLSLYRSCDNLEQLLSDRLLLREKVKNGKERERNTTAIENRQSSPFSSPLPSTSDSTSASAFAFASTSSPLSTSSPVPSPIPTQTQATLISTSSINGYGGLFSLVLNEEKLSPQIFYDELHVFKGPSLGTNFTLVCPYTILAHYGELDYVESCGVKTNLVRIAVGMEEIEDLKRRFLYAFEKAKIVPSSSSSSVSSLKIEN